MRGPCDPGWAGVAGGQLPFTGAPGCSALAKGSVTHTQQPSMPLAVSRPQTGTLG